MKDSYQMIKVHVSIINVLLMYYQNMIFLIVKFVKLMIVYFFTCQHVKAPYLCHPSAILTISYTVSYELTLLLEPQSIHASTTPQHTTCMIQTCSLAPNISKTPSLWADFGITPAYIKPYHEAVLKQTGLILCTGSAIHPYMLQFSTCRNKNNVWPG